MLLCESDPYDCRPGPIYSSYVFNITTTHEQTESASTEIELGTIGGTLGLIFGSYIFGRILQLAAPTVHDGEISDEDHFGRGTEYARYSTGKATLIVVDSADAAHYPLDWEGPGLCEDPRIWTANKIFSIFEPIGAPFKLRVYLATQHPFLSVFYNNFARKWECCCCCLCC